jgi:hypothetical protein
MVCLLGADDKRPISLARSLRPSRVVILHAAGGDNPGRADNVVRVLLGSFGTEPGSGVSEFRAESIPAGEEGDFLAWFRAIDRTLVSGGNVVIDLEGAAGVAAAAACLAAANRGMAIAHGAPAAPALKCFSPGILLAKPLGELDGLVLEHLNHGASTLGDITEALDRLKSTVSACLMRLKKEGFVRRWVEGRDVSFELQDGVSEALPYILEFRGRLR